MEDNSFKAKFSRAMDVVDSIVNFACVVTLSIMTIAALVMVLGRYLFSFVPRGTEQLAVMCMVWFSMISISLSIRDDTFIKMEIVDVILPKKGIKYFKIFSCIMNLFFAGCMVIYGMDMVLLTWATKLSGLRVPEGVLYLSLPVGGLAMLIASAAQVLELIWATEKKGGIVDDA